ncbi:glutamyl-tRNA amidotransferase subunit C [Fervidicella metallireducens AeB]|uniref:Aspartyl/glutamyl-tRNA(Asn/Gln) amidotransferase subunit C n=1 Tax=Fervidicella metallireducens AeB TaxID=1403537 RepID=A0A017RT72_9CLOT|nr:Asp-tRNA(Asn)/Glu-tRNA(Gln) amidotransferase subunit GatC [Fervidicella metallireducens]EYE87816.1 glutamyl-tRNA amidotransferase subunit C [Fervidicella metallireducens AeB]
MAVTIKDVEYVAKLARLEFNEQQMQKFTQDLNGILGYVEKLSEVDTEGVEISIHPFPMFNALREDIVRPSLDREEALLNAPEKEDNLFKVPKVIE